MQRFKNFMEIKQVYIYFVFLFLGAIVGLLLNDDSVIFETLTSIFISFLMFSMFAQIPFFNIQQTLLNYKYVLALILGNFILVPVLAFALLTIFGVTSTPIMIGLYLVLLTPCIDYVIVFTRLGKGNAEYMLISTPLLLILQFLLLPVYFVIFMGNDISQHIQIAPFLNTFVAFILLPLIFAIILQTFTKKSQAAKYILHFTEWLPVPLMAIVLFLIVGTHISKIIHDIHIILTVVPIYICYLIIAPIIGNVSAKLFQQPVRLRRTIIFSTSTRNALVVLPLSLSFPEQWATVIAVVIVTQTFIELIGQLIYIKLIPKLIQ